MNTYDPNIIELKWQEKWKKEGVYRDYSRKKKFYALDMFPYPSGAGLHVGHPKGYIATDVVSRFKMLNGYSVLHPMGWDAFGLPAENYAIKNKVHPRVAVEENVATFKKQLETFGFTYDWEKEINTTDPNYYKWTQWIFLKLFEKGLAYESQEPVNWCPSCQTVLANEDLEKGLCERCGTQVVQKKMRQWVLKMTDYADRLLFDLDKEDLDWEQSIIDQQKNWIGRSEGATVSFEIISNENKISKSQFPISNQTSNSNDTNSKQCIEVFTTRIDTIFGCTYCVVAPEHWVIENFKEKIRNYKEVEEYLIKAQNKTTLERTELQKEKTGVRLEGLSVINPFTKETVPLFVADYVLGNYGTGAVMAVPAHDERDWEFAKKYSLAIKDVIVGDVSECGNEDACAFVEDGVLIDSGNYTGLTSSDARNKMIEWLEKEEVGKRKVNYKMRDWVFSRQRYWGEPIPIVHCQHCGAVAIPEDQLPLTLPEVESYEPTGTGEGPLASIEEWVNTKCPKCGGLAKRETNTMPQWAGSSWYYLRYIDPKNNSVLVDKNLEKEWMPVDLYVGGAEHATRHLLYARFWHKFLHDIGVVSTAEPFKKLVHVGLILAEDGRKMSKRWNNVVNPDDVITQFGADAMRVYEMFMGPFTQSVAWSTNGVNGTRRFLDKIYSLQNKISEKYENVDVARLLHKTIKKVTEDIENFRFNTAISSLMVLVNAMEKEEEISASDYKLLIVLLSPFAPHITEEIWREKLGNEKSIFIATWPQFDPKLAKDKEIEMVVQVNGKVRDRLMVSADVTEDEAKETALESEKIKVFIEGKEIKKVIFVPGKLINIVV